MDPGWVSPFSTFWIFPLLCLIFMGVMMFMMFRSGGCMPMGRRDSRSNANRETPRQILDRRLARGEITRERYDAMRRDIETTGA